jgi:hypothetical protein
MRMDFCSIYKNNLKNRDIESYLKNGGIDAFVAQTMRPEPKYEATKLEKVYFAFVNLVKKN